MRGADPARDDPLFAEAIAELTNVLLGSGNDATARFVDGGDIDIA